MYQDPAKHVLLGQVLTGLRIADDSHALLFQTAEGDLVATTDGDCCSHTWIEHVELPALGFPAKVLAVENLDLPGVESEPDSYEVIQVYGLKIVTDRGEIIIDFRNSSNGYYGGSLNFPSADPEDYNYYYGGVFGQNCSTNNWKDITP